MKYFIHIFIALLILISCKSDETTTPQFLGELQKSITLGGSLNESLNAVVKTSDGGFISCGNIQSSDSNNLEVPKGESDYLIVKYDADFNLSWTKSYGGTSTEIAKSIIQTQDGGYIVSGFTKSNDLDVTGNNGQKDFWILKLTVNGSIQWKKTFGFSGQDESFSIIQTQDGGFFTCGYLDVTASGGAGNDDGTRNLNHGIGDYWGVKLDANGDFEWRRYFGGSKNDRATSALETSNGDFILTGSADSDDFDITNSKGSDDIWVIRISSEGTLIWNTSFGGNQIEDSFKVIETNDGNYFVLGTTISSDQDVSNNLGLKDIWLLKITPLGDLIWEKTYGGNQFDNATSIIALQDGNYMISGHTRSDDVFEIKGQNDILLIKIDGSGSIIWSDTFGGSNVDIANDIIETNHNTIVVVGQTESNDFDITGHAGFTDVLILEIK
ncbi:MAG: hypothetical protein L3J23_02025 [Flavobacteriaceae bacterium]|nr:hypothetical protein [Flavobacteriaceae bacterium]